MASEPLFIDSGGFYALVSVASAAHVDAVEIMAECRSHRRRAVTTDYILDETATLLRARGLTKQLKEFSFTDCASFVVMKELRLRDALTTDKHFRIAGFNPLLLE